MAITIQQGDTLSGIAQEQGTTVAALLSANPNISDPNLIQAGGSLNLPESGNIPVEQIGTQEIQLPQAEPGPIAPIQNETLSAFESLQAQPSALAGQDSAIAQRQLELLNLYRGEAGAFAAEKEARGVNELRNQFQTLVGDANVRQAEFDKLIEGTAGQGRGITTGIVASKQSKLAAIAGSELKIANSTALALQGRITEATAQAQEAVDLKYKPIEEELELLAAQREIIAPFLDREQKELARKQGLSDKIALNDLNDLKDTQKETLTSAIRNNAPKAVLDAINRANSPEEVLEAAGKYGVSIDEKIKRAQLSNIYSQIQDRATKSNGQTVELPPLTGVPSTDIAAIIKATGAKSTQSMTNAMNVIASVQGFADRNKEGVFKGFAPGIRFPFLRGEETRTERQTNIGDIEAINLKVQQWASGASLTDKQTKQVGRLVPDINDTDKQVKRKVNQLTNFMMRQVQGELAGQGIDYQPAQIDFFAEAPAGDSGFVIDENGNLVIDGIEVSNEEFFNNMAILRLQDAIEKAKSNPDSDFATKIRQSIESGAFDEAAQKQGVDLTIYGRPAPQETAFQRVSEDITERGENIQQRIAGEGEFADKSALERGVGATAEGFGALTSTAYNVLPEKARNLLDKIGGGIGKGFNFLVDKISDSKFLQEAVMSGETEKLESGLQVAADLGIISGEVLGAEGAIKGARLADKGIVKAGEAAVEGARKAGKLISDNNITNSVVKQFRKATKAAPTETLPQQQTLFKQTLKDSVIGDSSAINAKLEKLATEGNVSVDALLDDLIAEGGLPGIKGKKTSYRDFIESSEREFGSISKEKTRLLELDTETFPLESLRETSRSKVGAARAQGADLIPTEKAVDRVFESLKKKYGDTVTKADIDEIRINMNKKFKLDADAPTTASRKAIGDTSREILRKDKIIADALDHQTKLKRVQGTAEALNLKTIAVNEYIEKMGSFAGLMIAAGTGVSALAGGPAGLFMAAMAGNLGSKALARVLRKRMFSPDRLKLIKMSLDEHPDVLKTLIKDANRADKATLKKVIDVESKSGE